MKNTHGNDWTSGSDSNQTDDHLVGRRRSRPMTQLRWKKTVVIDDFIGTQKYELQQLWTGDFGDQEWRPIEFVE